MKCNWCGKGTGKNYTTDKKTNLTYYYYCSLCIGDFTGELIDKKLIEEFLSKKILIPSIAKIIEKETNEEYCSSELIAELIHDKLKEKWEERKKII